MLLLEVPGNNGNIFVHITACSYLQAGLSEEMFAQQYVRKRSVQLLRSTNKLIRRVNRISPFKFTLIMITTKGRGYIRGSICMDLYSGLIYF